MSGNSMGSANGSAALTARDIPLIRALVDAGMARTAIGKKFGCSRSTVTDIANGRTWASVNLDADDLPIIDELIAQGMSAEELSEKFYISTGIAVELGAKSEEVAA